MTFVELKHVMVGTCSPRRLSKFDAIAHNMIVVVYQCFLCINNETIKTNVKSDKRTRHSDKQHKSKTVVHHFPICKVRN